MSTATNAANGAAPEAAGGKKGPGKMIVIGGGAAALLLVAGGGAFVLMQSGMFSSSGEAEIAAVAEPYFLEMPELIVNLNVSGGGASYLRMRVSLELGDPAFAPLVEPRMPRVLDTFQVYLRELRASDLEGSAGIHRLKEELLRRVNHAVYPASVDNILFREILIQ